MRDLISFTGVSGTGKSTIAKEISKEYGHPYISLNQVLHKLSNNENITAQEYIRKYGIRRSSNNANIVIINFIKEHQQESIIFDGLYDYSLARIMAQRLPSFNLITVTVSAKDTLRLLRISQRKHVDLSTAKQICKERDSYKREVGIENIIRTSAISITNNSDIRTAIKLCDSCIKILRRCV